MIDFDAADDPFAALPATRQRSSSQFGWVAALAGLILLNSLAILRWTRLDTRPLAWDEAVHTRNALEYRDRLARGAADELLRPVYFNYPPLFNLSVIPFLDLAPDIADAGAYANVIYLALLVVGVYLIGARLMDRRAALAAAALVGFYPMVVMMARQTMLDLALTTWVTWAFYALIESDDFWSVTWSALFGIFLGLAMLTKWTAFLYLAGPALVSLVGASRRRSLAGIAVATLAGVVVMAPWFSMNLLPMLARVSALKDLPPAGGLILSGPASVLWYPIALFEQLNLPFLLLLVVGLMFAFGRRPLRPVLLWFLVSMALFTLINNRNSRYTLPALPAAALLSASWIEGRRWGLKLVLGLSLAYFLAFNFARVAPVFVTVAGVRLDYFDNHPPVQQDWKHREIIEAVAGRRDTSAPFSRVVVVSNAPYLHSTTLNITARKLGQSAFSFRGASKRRWLDFAEFILVKTGDLGPAFTVSTIQEHATWLASPPAWFPDVYKETGRWGLPDGSEAVLYHAEPNPRPVSANELFNISLGQVEMPNLVASNVEVTAVPISPDDTALGRLSRVEIRCSSITYKGMVLTDVALALDRPQINLPRYRDEGDVQLLALGTLSAQGKLASSTIIDYAAKKAKWLQDPKVIFDRETIQVGGRTKVAAIDLLIALETGAEVLRPKLRRVRVAGVSIPTTFFRGLTDRPIALSANREWPFRIDIGRIDGRGDVLEVGAP